MAYAKMQALGQFALQIQQQAAVITYSETFYALTVAMLLCIPLALLLKTPKPGAPVAEAAH
jgi:DHA2 family multidrug resistance protein